MRRRRQPNRYDSDGSTTLVQTRTAVNMRQRHADERPAAVRERVGHDDDDEGDDDGAGGDADRRRAAPGG